jgi:hypothetical protein
MAECAFCNSRAPDFSQKKQQHGSHYERAHSMREVDADLEVPISWQ